MLYSKSLVSKLLNHVCIIDIISHFITLRQRKSNENEYTALCPFHHEKTPSFTVARKKQFFHCFGCGCTGNAITFVMEHTGLRFVHAVKLVAKLSKFHLPHGRKPSKKKIKDREKYRNKLLNKRIDKQVPMTDEEVPF